MLQRLFLPSFFFFYICMANPFRLWSCSPGLLSLRWILNPQISSSKECNQDSNYHTCSKSTFFCTPARPPLSLPHQPHSWTQLTAALQRLFSQRPGKLQQGEVLREGREGRRLIRRGRRVRYCAERAPGQQLDFWCMLGNDRRGPQSRRISGPIR